LRIEQDGSVRPPWIEKDDEVEEAERKAEEEDQDEKDEEERVGMKGAFKWVVEAVDDSPSNSVVTGKPVASVPDGRTHASLTAVPACWSPPKGTSAQWLRPGMGMLFMYGGRKFQAPEVKRRGDPAQGRYRPRPTIPCAELWSYTPAMAR
jgi:hypothetical protein